MTSDQKKILKFIKEIDGFKEIFRKVHINKAKRFENDVEHSWHLAMMVWLFAPHFEKKIKLEKALKMALIHDLVEIYAGDVLTFDIEGRKNKKQREEKAAKKIFGILPNHLAIELRHLWNEYEERKSNEAFFVQALDKIHPTLQNTISGGKSWNMFQITDQMILDHKIKYLNKSPFLQNLFKTIFNEARRKKILYTP